ncbi:MAG TPA: response regulator [Nitrospirota bacterium]|nr:response regulator [Nitrospirota bacterium]
MPVKLLLADKSITIQKVVEMLFSGREYEVVCVSDGENALSEASRVVPDVVLADVDLPRIDGYNFAAKIKQVPALAQTPVILMMSRDDVYNDAKGRESGIIDHIAKPFESQDLIGKVKKALAAARIAEPAPAAPRPAAAPTPPKSPLVSTRPASPVVSPSAPKAASKPKQPTPPTDIFDIIQEAPTQAELKRAATPTPPEEDEGVFEVEPVVEVEEPLDSDLGQTLPLGDKAVEEMRAGLGLTNKKKESQPEIVTFESLDMATQTFGDFAPSPKPPQPAAEPPRSTARPADVVRKEPEVVTPSMPMPQISEEMIRRMAEETIAKMAKDMFAKLPPVQVPTLPESELRSMAEAAIAELAKEAFEMLPPPPQPPKVSEETVRRGIEEAVSKIAREMAREVFEKVAWEVIPELAELLIKQEIERLKAET